MTPGMSDKNDNNPVKSRADSILAEINPQRAKKRLSDCPKCQSTNFTIGGGLGEMLMFRCNSCRYEFPLGHTSVVTSERQHAAPFAPPVSGPYDGDSYTPPDRGMPSFRGRGRPYQFEDDE